MVDNKTTTIAFRVTSEQGGQLLDIANKRGVCLSKLLRKIIKKFLKDFKG
jgi:hypothetical protein